MTKRGGSGRTAQVGLGRMISAREWESVVDPRPSPTDTQTLSLSHSLTLAVSLSITPTDTPTQTSFRPSTTTPPSTLLLSARKIILGALTAHPQSWVRKARSFSFSFLLLFLLLSVFLSPSCCPRAASDTPLDKTMADHPSPQRPRRRSSSRKCPWETS